MDSQSIFNVATGLAGFLGGWVMKMLWETQKELRRDMKKLEEGLPETYVRRDDFKDFMAQIWTKLDRIEGKLDGKVDK